MQKRSTLICIFMLASMTLAGCGANKEAGPPTELYDSSVDYMALMVESAAIGDLDTLYAASFARNAKIESLGLSYQTLEVEEFLEQYEDYSGFSMERDYLSEMAAYCLKGDISGGIEAEQKRNLKISMTGSSAERISFEDLYLLSKIITVEAGSDWLPMEWRMMVGEVLLNRVASPEFPDTMAECVYQAGQYASGSDPGFPELLPNQNAVEAAVRLLSGERVIRDPSVVFQGNTEQGSGVYRMMTDDILGTTYFCYSNYPELYP